MTREVSAPASGDVGCCITARMMPGVVLPVFPPRDRAGTTGGTYECSPSSARAWAASSAPS
eukprot:11205679-Lingulodinium_polyedra.AAC.1